MFQLSIQIRGFRSFVAVDKKLLQSAPKYRNLLAIKKISWESRPPNPGGGRGQPPPAPTPRAAFSRTLGRKHPSHSIPIAKIFHLHSWTAVIANECIEWTQSQFCCIDLNLKKNMQLFHGVYFNF